MWNSTTRMRRRSKTGQFTFRRQPKYSCQWLRQRLWVSSEKRAIRAVASIHSPAKTWLSRRKCVGERKQKTSLVFLQTKNCLEWHRQRFWLGWQKDDYLRSSFTLHSTTCDIRRSNGIDDRKQKFTFSLQEHAGPSLTAQEFWHVATSMGCRLDTWLKDWPERNFIDFCGNVRRCRQFLSYRFSRWIPQKSTPGFSTSH